MERVSVLFLDRRGAGPVYSLEMAKALLDEGGRLQLFISTYVDNLDAWKECFSCDDRVELHIIPTYRNLLEFILSLFNIFLFKNICRQIVAFAPLCVYCPFVPLWSFILFRFLRRKHIRIVSTIHDVILHTGEIKNSFLSYVFEKIHAAEIKLSDDIILLNTKDVAVLVEKYKKEKYCVIPHACFNYYKTHLGENEFRLRKTIAFIGRIEYYKGVELLVDAFMSLQHKDINLLIAGRGDVSSIVDKCRVKREQVILINRWIEDHEFQEILDNVDIVVLPYNEATQSGIIPLAFAFGKTVIATNVGALSEQVPDGTGLIVNADKYSIVSALDYLYDNPHLIEQYGHNAFVYANTELTWSKSAKLLLNYLSNKQETN